MKLKNLWVGTVYLLGVVSTGLALDADNIWAKQKLGVNMLPSQTPSQELHVLGQGMFSSSTQMPGIYLRDDLDSETWGLRLSLSGNYLLFTQGPNWCMTLSTNTLKMISSSRSHFALKHPSINDPFYIGVDEDASSNMHLELYYGAAQDSLVMKQNGDIGIGTDAPGAKLEVEGNIIADDPTDVAHVVTLGYLENQPIYEVGGSANLDLTQNRITNISNPVNDQDAVNKQSMDAAISTALNNVPAKGGIAMYTPPAP